MSLCIMHLLQIAPAWKKQFLQGHIHCTWNQTSDSQLTSMQALADADIELEKCVHLGQDCCIAWELPISPHRKWSFLVASGCGWSKCMTSPRHVPIATGHEQEILAPVVTIAPVLCMFLEFLCIFKKTSFTFSPRKLLEKVRAPEFSRFLFQKLPEPVQQVVYHLTQKILSKSWSLEVLVELSWTAYFEEFPNCQRYFLKWLGVTLGHA